MSPRTYYSTLSRAHVAASSASVQLALISGGPNLDTVLETSANQGEHLTRWVNKPRAAPANSNASHRACYRPMLTHQGKLRRDYGSRNNCSRWHEMRLIYVNSNATSLEVAPEYTKSKHRSGPPDFNRDCRVPPFFRRHGLTFRQWCSGRFNSTLFLASLSSQKHE